MKIITVHRRSKKGEILESHDIKVDDEDYDKLMTFAWVWRDGYAATRFARRWNLMHRMVMNAGHHDGVIIDHIDGDHTNNQKVNLRRANRFENQQNRKTNRNNQLPKGIRLLPSGKYNVRVQAYNKRITFGAFDTVEEAIDARNKVAKQMHGQFYRASDEL